MPAAPPARLLDLTRLVSRAGRGALTGIDRVEMAYLAQLLAEPVPLHAVLRAAPGYVLLDRDGAAALASRLCGEVAWGRPDWIARLHLRQPAPRRAAQSDLRRLARGWAPPAGLRRLLTRHLPAGTSYLNVGHSNLSARMINAVRAIPGARIGVMLHDTIPLDHPCFAAPGVPEAFARKLACIAAGADLVICNSAVTAADAARHMRPLGRVPPLVVAHLGVTPATPDPAALPAAPDPARPYFVALGTIEPRKNHALLMDVWARLAQGPDAVPQLVIVGARGWRNAALLARLDGDPMMGRDIHELGALDDGAAAALLRDARALLFPSLAEGYGLPPLEAMALGTPVICSDLPVLREVLGDYPVYADPRDSYSWYRAVRAARPQGHAPVTRVPGWAAHFATVLERA